MGKKLKLASGRTMDSSEVDSILKEIEKGEHNPVYDLMLRFELLHALGWLKGNALIPVIGKDFFASYFTRVFGMDYWPMERDDKKARQEFEEEAIKRGLPKRYRKKSKHLRIIKVVNILSYNSYFLAMLKEGGVDVLLLKGLTITLGEMYSSYQRYFSDLHEAVKDFIIKVNEELLNEGGCIILAEGDLWIGDFIKKAFGYIDLLEQPEYKRVKRVLSKDLKHVVLDFKGPYEVIVGRVPIRIFPKPLDFYRAKREDNKQISSSPINFVNSQQSTVNRIKQFRSSSPVGLTFESRVTSREYHRILYSKLITKKCSSSPVGKDKDEVIHARIFAQREKEEVAAFTKDFLVEKRIPQILADFLGRIGIKEYLFFLEGSFAKGNVAIKRWCDLDIYLVIENPEKVSIIKLWSLLQLIRENLGSGYAQIYSSFLEFQFAENHEFSKMLRNRFQVSRAPELLIIFAKNEEFISNYKFIFRCIFYLENKATMVFESSLGVREKFLKQWKDWLKDENLRKKYEEFIRQEKKYVRDKNKVRLGIVRNVNKKRSNSPITRPTHFSSSVERVTFSNLRKFCSSSPVGKEDKIEAILHSFLSEKELRKLELMVGNLPRFSENICSIGVSRFEHDLKKQKIEKTELMLDGLANLGIDVIKKTFSGWIAILSNPLPSLDMLQELEDDLLEKGTEGSRFIIDGATLGGCCYNFYARIVEVAIRKGHPVEVILISELLTPDLFDHNVTLGFGISLIKKFHSYLRDNEINYLAFFNSNLFDGHVFKGGEIEVIIRWFDILQSLFDFLYQVKERRKIRRQSHE